MGTYKGFTSVELRRPTRSNFNLSHEKRISSRVGKLTPVLITETMPNDTFRGSTEVLVKLAPLIAPIYHRLNLYVHYFFIPNRLLWEDWETFITGGRLGEAVTNPPVPPYFAVTGALTNAEGLLEIGSLADYLGIPRIPDSATGPWAARTLDYMPFAAFYKAWYDYYRDRNYVADNELLPMPSGQSSIGTHGALLQTRYRCWEHDYFTSALLTTQRGVEVLMPLQGSGSLVLSAIDDDPVPVSKDLGISPTVAGQLASHDFGAATGYEDAKFVLENSEVSINDLRRANRLQEWLDRNQLAGSRYSESIMAHFGRNSSDGRLQRAE